MKTFDLGAVTAYALAVKHGYKGTEKEWVAHMQANATQATEAEANAKQYAANAKTSETNAGKSATNAQTAATNAATSAQNAAKSAEEAKKAEGIKTVNGKTPDENGNVEIDSVASWNDLTDKPFGEESGVVEILPECQPTYDAAESGFFIENAPALEIGKTYTVNWNGTEYSCVAQDLSNVAVAGAAGLGDCSLWGDATLTGNGEPFTMMISEENGIRALIAISYDGTTELTVSIKTEQTTLVPLPTKYLPDGVPYCVDGGVVEILPECQPEFVEDDGVFVVTDGFVDFELGKTYIVMWNGTEYTCVGQDMSAMVRGAVGIGDLTNFGASGNGEPFLAVTMLEEGTGIHSLSIMPLDGTTELTISIYKEGADIRKLDNRCLDLAWLPTLNDVWKEHTPEFTDDDNNNFNILRDAPALVAGKTYLVTYDGVEYVCNAIDFAAMMGEPDVVYIVIGNYDFGANEDVVTGNGEPFWFRYWDMGGDSDARLEVYHEVYGQGIAHTVSIKEQGEEPNKMPSKFLPTDATVFHLTSPNGTKFAVTVSDDGTLSASAVTE